MHLSFYYLLLFIISARGGRTKEKIYKDLTSISACFRRLNGTHQVGCSSSQKGSVGVVHHVQTQEDLQYILKDGPHAPYIVVISVEEYNEDTIISLKRSGKVNGIILDRSNASQTPKSFSSDAKCPNAKSGMYGGTTFEQCKDVNWNGPGNSLSFIDFGFPFMILQSSSDYDVIINKCFKPFNEPINGVIPSYPLCSAQLKDFMYAAKDSPTCIRRAMHNNMFQSVSNSFCAPLAGRNIHVVSLPVQDSSPNPPVILLMVRMDAFSMFDGISPSAESVVSGLVTFLSVVDTLSRVQTELQNSNISIMFAMFQGEAFDYIGSSRFVYDLPKGKMSLTLESFLEIYEVGQMGNGNDTVFLHVDPLSNRNTSIKDTVDEMVNDLVESGLAQNLAISRAANTEQALPPASMQSFLKEKNISALYLADHKTQFENSYYNSIFDVASQLDYHCLSANSSDMGENSTQHCYDMDSVIADRLTKVSSALSSSLYKRIVGTVKPMQADLALVKHLLYCLLIRPNCTLFRESTTLDNDKRISNRPYPFYVSVASGNPHLALIMKYLMVNFWGTKLANITEKECKEKSEKGMQFIFLNGTCVRHQVNSSEALSPAFTIEGYDWESGQYSTWTESVWPGDAFSARVFLVPNPSQEMMTLVVGLVLFALTLLLAYILKQRAHILFKSRP